MRTHWKKLTNPDYLGAYAFDQGEEKLVTIDHVAEEAVTGPEGRKDNCMVLHFRQKEVKPLILNHTNAKTIERLTESPYIEDWAGRSIILVVRTVSAFGSEVEAVRVKLEKVSGICEVCGKRVIAAGGMSGSQVADYTMDRFGAVLCAECAKKRGKPPALNEEDAGRSADGQAGN